MFVHKMWLAMVLAIYIKLNKFLITTETKEKDTLKYQTRCKTILVYSATAAPSEDLKL